MKNTVMLKRSVYKKCFQSQYPPFLTETCKIMSIDKFWSKAPRQTNELLFFLVNNDFTLNNKWFLQVGGTAMGKKNSYGQMETKSIIQMSKSTLIL